MNNLNSVLIEGYLVRDPQAKDINGTMVCACVLACNRYYKKDNESTQETSYFNIELWGKTAENCHKFLKKGSGIRVVGRLKQDKWKDGNEQYRQSVKIVGEHVDFFPKKKDQGQTIADVTAPSMPDVDIQSADDTLAEKESIDL